MKDEYVVGSGKPPSWLKNKIMPYRKMDGTTGFEFHGRQRTYVLYCGNKLVRNGSRIGIKRCKKNGQK
jgi:hypothetical protein